MVTIDLVAAARPNFMKIAPLFKALSREPWAKVRIIHTGQHYDNAMSGVFFQEFGLPKPWRNLGIGSGTHGQQTGRVLEAYEAHLLADRPDLVIVAGDVNATPAAALAAAKLHIPVAHLEAGLRSFDRSMPEELNRCLTDCLCDILWTPSEDADRNLLAEGVAPERIHRVGNIMIDTLVARMPAIQASPVLTELALAERSFALVTLHRPSNVDDAKRLSSLCRLLCSCARELPLVFPLHPRTRARLQDFGLMEHVRRSPVLLTEPLPYTAFMRLVSSSRAVITDSGGVQEETSYLGIPCLTLRENTERPVTLKLGTNQLVTANALPEALHQVLSQDSPHGCHIPLWDGHTADRIVQHLTKVFAL